MRRLILVAAVAVALLSGACQKMPVIPSGDAVAALQLAGFTEVVIEKPTFTCGTGDKVEAVEATRRNFDNQNGVFFKAKLKDEAVRGALCYGEDLPPRISILL